MCRGYCIKIHDNKIIKRPGHEVPVPAGAFLAGVFVDASFKSIR